MRALTLMLCPALLLVATAAGAQAQDSPPTTPESITRVEVVAPPQAYAFWEYDAETISGGYAMSNGWRLKVDPTSDGIVAQIDRQRPIRLVALSQDLYVTRDGNVSMEFNRGSDGQDMLMSYVPAGSRTAQVVVVTTTRLAQR
jgi:hypothetical protein